MNFLFKMFFLHRLRGTPTCRPALLCQSPRDHPQQDQERLVQVMVQPVKDTLEEEPLADDPLLSVHEELQLPHAHQQDHPEAHDAVLPDQEQDSDPQPVKDDLYLHVNLCHRLEVQDGEDDYPN